MEIRDLIHGTIAIENRELPVLDSIYFQRLRQIRQMGFAEYSYPTANHNRFTHSLGAMETASRVFDTLFGGPQAIAANRVASSDAFDLFSDHKETHARLRQAVRFAALLHDVGHGPLSHTTEFAMPRISELHLSVSRGPTDRLATHEDYTLKLILDSGLTPLLEKAGSDFGVKPIHVAALIDSGIPISNDFFTETIHGRQIDLRPVCSQIISSELDCDRMDYLRRDSLLCGVSYGQFDFDWLAGNLTPVLKDDACYLGVQHRALYAFEDFLISRFHMFLMVYFHHKSVIFDEMLRKYFQSPDCDYRLPSDIESYCQHDDAELLSHLVRSKNPWAQRISRVEPYRVLVELHSGIPASSKAREEQDRLLENLEKELGRPGEDYLLVTSRGELSKYFHKTKNPIYVHYDNLYSEPDLIPLEKCTDLFERYPEARSITRVYVPPETLRELKEKGKGSRLEYR